MKIIIVMLKFTQSLRFIDHEEGATLRHEFSFCKLYACVTEVAIFAGNN